MSLPSPGGDVDEKPWTVNNLNVLSFVVSEVDSQLVRFLGSAPAVMHDCYGPAVIVMVDPVTTDTVMAALVTSVPDMAATISNRSMGTTVS
jgi:hypothetical protein